MKIEASASPQASTTMASFGANARQVQWLTRCFGHNQASPVTTQRCMSARDYCLPSGVLRLACRQTPKPQCHFRLHNPSWWSSLSSRVGFWIAHPSSHLHSPQVCLWSKPWMVTFWVLFEHQWNKPHKAGIKTTSIKVIFSSNLCSSYHCEIDNLISAETLTIWHAWCEAHDMWIGFFVCVMGRTWYLPSSLSCVKAQRDCLSLIPLVLMQWQALLCARFPDVCCFMLSKSISILLMSAPQPVSYCCISCLVVCKCGSKHTGIERKLIVFDTCSEAGQLALQQEDSFPFFPSNTFLNKTQRGLPSQCTFSRKLSVSQPRTNLCVSCLYFIFLQVLDNTDSEQYLVFWENSPRILSIGRLILHNEVSHGCVVRKWCQSILKEGKWGFLDSTRVDGVDLKTVFFRMWTFRPPWTGLCIFTWCTPRVALRTITWMYAGIPCQALKVQRKNVPTEEWVILICNHGRKENGQKFHY